MTEPESIRAICATCGNDYRKHKVLHEVVRTNFEPLHHSPLMTEYYRLVECGGCESIKYVISSEYVFPTDGQEGEFNFRVYPDAPNALARRAPRIEIVETPSPDGQCLIPTPVLKMYMETINAMNAGCFTLAAGGLRATVEAICLDKQISGRNLHDKINELASRQFLTSAQAEFFHESRYLGNAALHELTTPSVNAIEDGLGITEGLINTIYVLPDKASRLRQQREQGNQEGR